MPSRTRIVVPGVPHHVTRRGNNQQEVFFVDEDRRTDSRFGGEQADQYGLAVMGYRPVSDHRFLIALEYPFELLLWQAGPLVRSFA